MRSVNKLLHMFSAQSGFNIVPESIRNVWCLQKLLHCFSKKVSEVSSIAGKTVSVASWHDSSQSGMWDV